MSIDQVFAQSRRHNPAVIGGETCSKHRVNTCRELELTSVSPPSLDQSSHAASRPPYGQTHQSSQANSSGRPQFNRQISAVSTHSPSGRPHPPFFAPPEPKKKTKGRKTLLNRIADRQSAHNTNPQYTNGTATSFNWRSGRPMAGMLEIERSRTRRERTFIGSECAVCEEPLEHTLRGERILQFSCGHVSHEACFYEYIKEFESQYCPTCNAPLGLDTSRGGNVLDLGMRNLGHEPRGCK